MSTALVQAPHALLQKTGAMPLRAQSGFYDHFGHRFEDGQFAVFAARHFGSRSRLGVEDYKVFFDEDNWSAYVYRGNLLARAEAAWVSLAWITGLYRPRGPTPQGVVHGAVAKKVAIGALLRSPSGLQAAVSAEDPRSEVEFLNAMIEDEPHRLFVTNDRNIAAAAEDADLSLTSLGGGRWIFAA